MKYLMSLLTLILVWKVKAEGTGCLFETFREAYEDYKSHDRATLLPKLITFEKFKRLPEFKGW